VADRPPAAEKAVILPGGGWLNCPVTEQRGDGGPDCAPKSERQQKRDNQHCSFLPENIPLYFRRVLSDRSDPAERPTIRLGAI
jgi:hypothetical protein